MFPVKNYAVLVIVYVRTVLQIVRLAAKCDGDYAVVLPCRMGQRAGISFVLAAQKAKGIARLGSAEPGR